MLRCTEIYKQDSSVLRDIISTQTSQYHPFHDNFQLLLRSKKLISLIVESSLDSGLFCCVKEDGVAHFVLKCEQTTGNGSFHVSKPVRLVSNKGTHRIHSLFFHESQKILYVVLMNGNVEVWGYLKLFKVLSNRNYGSKSKDASSNLDEGDSATVNGDDFEDNVNTSANNNNNHTMEGEGLQRLHVLISPLVQADPNFQLQSSNNNPVFYLKHLASLGTNLVETSNSNQTLRLIQCSASSIAIIAESQNIFWYFDTLFSSISSPFVVQCPCAVRFPDTCLPSGDSHVPIKTNSSKVTVTEGEVSYRLSDICCVKDSLFLLFFSRKSRHVLNNNLSNNDPSLCFEKPLSPCAIAIVVEPAQVNNGYKLRIVGRQNLSVFDNIHHSDVVSSGSSFNGFSSVSVSVTDGLLSGLNNAASSLSLKPHVLKKDETAGSVTLGFKHLRVSSSTADSVLTETCICGTWMFNEVFLATLHLSQDHVCHSVSQPLNDARLLFGDAALFDDATWTVSPASATQDTVNPKPPKEITLKSDRFNKDKRLQVASLAVLDPHYNRTPTDDNAFGRVALLDLHVSQNSDDTKNKTVHSENTQNTSVSVVQCVTRDTVDVSVRHLLSLPDTRHVSRVSWMRSVSPEDVACAAWLGYHLKEVGVSLTKDDQGGVAYRLLSMRRCLDTLCDTTSDTSEVHSFMKRLVILRGAYLHRTCFFTSVTDTLVNIDSKTAFQNERTNTVCLGCDTTDLSLRVSLPCTTFVLLPKKDTHSSDGSLDAVSSDGVSRHLSTTFRDALILKDTADSGVTAGVTGGFVVALSHGGTRCKIFAPSSNISRDTEDSTAVSLEMVCVVDLSSVATSKPACDTPNNNKAAEEENMKVEGLCLEGDDTDCVVVLAKTRPVSLSSSTSTSVDDFKEHVPKKSSEQMKLLFFSLNTVTSDTVDSAVSRVSAVSRGSFQLQENETVRHIKFQPLSLSFLKSTHSSDGVMDAAMKRAQALLKFCRMCPGVSQRQVAVVTDKRVVVLSVSAGHVSVSYDSSLAATQSVGVADVRHVSQTALDVSWIGCDTLLLRSSVDNSLFTLHLCPATQSKTQTETQCKLSETQWKMMDLTLRGAGVSQTVSRHMLHRLCDTNATQGLLRHMCRVPRPQRGDVLCVVPCLDRVLCLNLLVTAGETHLRVTQRPISLLDTLLFSTLYTVSRHTVSQQQQKQRFAMSLCRAAQVVATHRRWSVSCDTLGVCSDTLLLCLAFNESVSRVNNKECGNVVLSLVLKPSLGFGRVSTHTAGVSTGVSTGVATHNNNHNNNNNNNCVADRNVPRYLRSRWLAFLSLATHNSGDTSVDVRHTLSLLQPCVAGVSLSTVQEALHYRGGAVDGGHDVGYLGSVSQTVSLAPLTPSQLLLSATARHALLRHTRHTQTLNNNKDVSSSSATQTQTQSLVCLWRLLDICGEDLSVLKSVYRLFETFHNSETLAIVDAFYKEMVTKRVAVSSGKSETAVSSLRFLSRMGQKLSETQRDTAWMRHLRHIPRDTLRFPVSLSQLCVSVRGVSHRSVSSTLLTLPCCTSSSGVSLSVEEALTLLMTRDTAATQQTRQQWFEVLLSESDETVSTDKSTVLSLTLLEEYLCLCDTLETVSKNSQSNFNLSSNFNFNQKSGGVANTNNHSDTYFLPANMKPPGWQDGLFNDLPQDTVSVPQEDTGTDDDTDRDTERDTGLQMSSAQIKQQLDRVALYCRFSDVSQDTGDTDRDTDRDTVDDVSPLSPQTKVAFQDLSKFEKHSVQLYAEESVSRRFRVESSVSDVEPNEKHESAKLLCDVVCDTDDLSAAVSSSTTSTALPLSSTSSLSSSSSSSLSSSSGLRVPVSRGSALDLALYQKDTTRNRCTVEFHLALKFPGHTPSVSQPVVLMDRVCRETQAVLWRLTLRTDGRLSFDVFHSDAQKNETAAAAVSTIVSDDSVLQRLSETVLSRDTEDGDTDDRDTPLPQDTLQSWAFHHFALRLDGSPLECVAVSQEDDVCINVSRGHLRVSLLLDGREAFRSHATLTPGHITERVLRHTVMRFMPLSPTDKVAYRLTELRVWSLWRHKEVLRSARDTPLQLAEKRFRLTMQLKGTKRLFKPFQRIVLSNDSVSGVAVSPKKSVAVPSQDTKSFGVSQFVSPPPSTVSSTTIAGVVPPAPGNASVATLTAREKRLAAAAAARERQSSSTVNVATNINANVANVANINANTATIATTGSIATNAAVSQSVSVSQSVTGTPPPLASSTAAPKNNIINNNNNNNFNNNSSSNFNIPPSDTSATVSSHNTRQPPATHDTASSSPSSAVVSSLSSLSHSQISANSLRTQILGSGAAFCFGSHASPVSQSVSATHGHISVLGLLDVSPGHRDTCVLQMYLCVQSKCVATLLRLTCALPPSSATHGAVSATQSVSSDDLSLDLTVALQLLPSSTSTSTTNNDMRVLLALHRSKERVLVLYESELPGTHLKGEEDTDTIVLKEVREVVRIPLGKVPLVFFKFVATELLVLVTANEAFTWRAAANVSTSVASGKRHFDPVKILTRCDYDTVSSTNNSDLWRARAVLDLSVSPGSAAAERWTLLVSRVSRSDDTCHDTEEMTEDERTDECVARLTDQQLCVSLHHFKTGATLQLKQRCVAAAFVSSQVSVSLWVSPVSRHSVDVCLAVHPHGVLTNGVATQQQHIEVSWDQVQSLCHGVSRVSQTPAISHVWRDTSVCLFDGQLHVSHCVAAVAQLHLLRSFSGRAFRLLLVQTSPATAVVFDLFLPQDTPSGDTEDQVRVSVVHRVSLSPSRHLRCAVLSATFDATKKSLSALVVDEEVLKEVADMETQANVARHCHLVQLSDVLQG